MVGNALDAVSGLLAGLGLVRTTARNTIEDAVTAEVTSRGLRASVHSVRYRVATLMAAPQDATLLRMDCENIREAVNAVVDEPLDRIVVRVGNAA